MCVSVHVCVCVCARACVHACVRACMRVCDLNNRNTRQESLHITAAQIFDKASGSCNFIVIIFMK